MPNAPADHPPEDEILVALVDDNRISREAHARVLNAQPGVRVISAEASLSVTMLTEREPDVVLVDAGATEVLSLRAAVTTRRVLPEASVVITDLETENDDIADYVKAGVKGFVLGDASATDFVGTVQSVADGAHVLPDALTSPLFLQIAAQGIELEAELDAPPVRARVTVGLTIREEEVVGLIREGLANKAIAARLLISTHTVKSHVRSAMEKTGLHTRVLLAIKPLGQGGTGNAKVLHRPGR
jgi:DNA-binding NarL/FixJ family response regulator